MTPNVVLTVVVQFVVRRQTNVYPKRRNATVPLS